MKLRLVIDVIVKDWLLPKDKAEHDSLCDVLRQQGIANNGLLILHSNFLGEEIGTVNVVDIQGWL